MAHPVWPESYLEINNFYTATVYNKGAEVIRMLRTLLGVENFRRGLQLYLSRHDGQAATVDGFVRAMADASGTDLGQFDLWYSQAGTPRLEVAGEYDAAARVYTLTVRQSCPPTPGQPQKKPFHIPLAAGLLDRQGRDLPLRLEGEEAAAPGPGRVLQLRRGEEVFRFLDIPGEPVPSLLRGFSAPVQLIFPWRDEDLAFLLAHDSDPYNRWEAGQELATRVLLGLIESQAKGRPLKLPGVLLQAYRALLADRGADPALAAQVLTLPSEIYLAEQMDVIDPQAIHAAREFLRLRLAGELREELLRLYRTFDDTGPYSIDPEAVGRRSLKNLCLNYLTTLETPESIDLAWRQFQQGGNMTDVIAALSSLANSEAAQGRQALEEFHQRWRGESLVIDKWFTLQATSRRVDALATVERLLQHPAFNLRNPNRVRSLLGAFCHGNPARFHDPGGAGYRLLGEQVLALDRLNPQVAARLVSALSRWRRYEPVRQRLMGEELRRIHGTAGISRDVFEIVSKSLEEG